MSSCGQKFLLGGGGFSTNADSELELYMLGLTGRSKPRVCLIPTATGDSAAYISKFNDRFKSFPCEYHTLSLFKPHTANISEFIFSMDIVYVGGGNTRNLLVLWKEWGICEALREANRRGVVIAGVSAGLICWFEKGVTDSQSDKLGVLDGLGELEGICCPHFDTEVGRREMLESSLLESRYRIGYGVQDGVALHFQSNSLIEAVTSRENRGYFHYKFDEYGNLCSEFKLARLLAQRVQ